MRRIGSYLASLDPQLPGAVWFLEAGFFVNAFGTGVAYPFLVIYLHNVRGLSLATAGLVIAVSGVAGLATGPLFGRLVDRVGAKVTLATALALGACAYGLFPLVHEAWAAFLVGCLVGLSSGSFCRRSPPCSPASPLRLGGTRHTPSSAACSTSAWGWEV
jgi:predicted MFS family arabinose efflux permease